MSEGERDAGASGPEGSGAEEAAGPGSALGRYLGRSSGGLASGPLGDYLAPRAGAPSPAETEADALADPAPAPEALPEPVPEPEPARQTRPASKPIAGTTSEPAPLPAPEAAPVPAPGAAPKPLLRTARGFFPQLTGLEPLPTEDGRKPKRGTMVLAASGMLLLLGMVLALSGLDRAWHHEETQSSAAHLIVDPQIVVDPDRPGRWYVAFGRLGSGSGGPPGAVHAYDDVRLLWRSEVPQTSLLHPVVVAAGAGLVYVQGEAGLVVLDADSGAPRVEISHPSVSEAPGSHRYDEEREMIVMFGHAGGPVQQLPLGAFVAEAADGQTRERWAEAGDGSVSESSRRQFARPLEAPAFQGPSGEYTMLGEPPSLALGGTRLGATELPDDASFLMARRLLPCGAPGATAASGAQDPSATSSAPGVCSAGLVAPGAENGYVSIRAGRWFYLVSLADGSVPVHGAMNGEPESVFALPDGTVGFLGGDHWIMTLSPDGFLGRSNLAANELEHS